MMAEFEQYKPRKISFLHTRQIAGWWVKLYTITCNKSFGTQETVRATMQNMDMCFIHDANASALPTHRHAFVIVHEAREGIWILASWWTGGEMLETKVHFATYEEPTIIKPSPHDGMLVCVWELQVFTHEGNAWVRHVLNKAVNPDFEAYQNDGLST